MLSCQDVFISSLTMDFFPTTSDGAVYTTNGGFADNDNYANADSWTQIFTWEDYTPTGRESIHTLTCIDSLYV